MVTSPISITVMNKLSITQCASVYFCTPNTRDQLIYSSLMSNYYCAVCGREQLFCVSHTENRGYFFNRKSVIMQFYEIVRIAYYLSSMYFTYSRLQSVAVVKHF